MVLRELLGLDAHALDGLAHAGVILPAGRQRRLEPPRLMLALLGFLTIAVLLALIMSKRASPLVALVAVPTAAALAGGFGFRTGGFMVKGVEGIAPVAGMFVFAILYFGIMTDAGMLDPIIDRILAAVGSNPARIVVGTALLALLVHLDGSGAVMFPRHNSRDAAGV